MKLNENDAKALLKAAIDAGALKLSGPSGSKDSAARQAEFDATHLLTLLEKLQEDPKP
jgi:hypothetical protein